MTNINDAHNIGIDPDCNHYGQYMHDDEMPCDDEPDPYENTDRWRDWRDKELRPVNDIDYRKPTRNPTECPTCRGYIMARTCLTCDQTFTHEELTGQEGP